MVKLRNGEGQEDVRIIVCQSVVRESKLEWRNI